MKRIVLFPSLLCFIPFQAEGAMPAPSPVDDTARFALVIGRNEPEDPKQAELRYADDDAISMHELLEEAGVRSLLLVSPDRDTAALRQMDHTETPTLGAVLRAFETVSGEITSAAKHGGKKTELTIFYSGHGDVDGGEGFVVLAGGRLTRTVLLEQIIARSPADVNHVIIDACKSYFMVFDKGPGGKRRPFYRLFDISASGRNLDRTGFVLSASSDEDSHEWERYQAGIFSYEVRSALRGAADADLNGLITYGELGAFVTTANRGIANPSFRPDFMVRPPGKDAENLTEPLLRWNDTVSSLTVDSAAAGHYYIETTTGIRIADVHSKRAQQLSVHLPKSRPLFVRRADNLAEGVLTTSESIRLSSLAMAPTTVARKGALSLAFESLFATPFGIEVVQAYDALYAKKAASLNAPPEVPAYLKPSIRHALLGICVGSLAVGGTMSILALTVRNDAKRSSQSTIPSMNQSIERYNTAAIALYSVAAVAGISWLTLELLWLKKTHRDVIAFPIVFPTELGLGLGATWGE